MTRDDFKKISEMRVKDASVLLDAGCYPGAYYLIGYAVECALKACVARQVQQYDFPDKKLAEKVYTHNLEKLMEASGLAPLFNGDKKKNNALEVNWAIVKDWTEAARYNGEITKEQAHNLCTACADEEGILSWVKKQW